MVSYQKQRLKNHKRISILLKSESGMTRNGIILFFRAYRYNIPYFIWMFRPRLFLQYIRKCHVIIRKSTRHHGLSCDNRRARAQQHNTVVVWNIIDRSAYYHTGVSVENCRRRDTTNKYMYSITGDTDCLAIVFAFDYATLVCLYD